MSYLPDADNIRGFTVHCVVGDCAWVEYDDSADTASLKAIMHFTLVHREPPS